MSARYSEKLRDPRWQKLRLQIFERDQWTCQFCGRRDKTLAVHHRYYELDRYPWESSPAALITVCEICHESEYLNRPGAEHRLLLELKRFGLWASDIDQLARAFARAEMFKHPWVVTAVVGRIICSKERLAAIRAELGCTDEDIERIVAEARHT